jgi:diketogulonate reductase-like aldo/keto reductase
MQYDMINSVLTMLTRSEVFISEVHPPPSYGLCTQRKFYAIMANTRVKLNDNTTIPLLAFGTGTAHYEKEAENMVTAAINAGFTHLDGAQAYRNEESLGAGIAAAGKPREQLFVTTKLYKLAEGRSVRDTLVESLTKLRLAYVDLFLIHSPLWFSEPGRLKEVWKQVEALKKEGLARSIGVSNFRTAQLREILDGAEFPPSVNQVGQLGRSTCLTPQPRIDEH